VSTSPPSTCPDSCALKGNGCYAETGRVRWQWRAAERNGVAWLSFLAQVRYLPGGQLWRHNVAGDLPGEGNLINPLELGQLVRANKGKCGFTYTHYPMTPHNRAQVEAAVAQGFTINVSTDRASDAVALRQRGLKAPLVTILPIDAPNDQWLQGVRIVACPAEKTDKVQCSNCGLCQQPDRGYVIGFRAHGSSKRTVDVIARSSD
jgi:hypothetical protein